MRLLISLCIAIMMITGCTQVNLTGSKEYVIGNPTAKEILINDPNADIFQYKDIIYTNASGIEWVQQADLTIGKSVGTIQKQYQPDLAFENGMATELPVGTVIYEPMKKSGPILIVVVNDEEVRYLGLIEG